MEVAELLRSVSNILQTYLIDPELCYSSLAWIIRF